MTARKQFRRLLAFLLTLGVLLGCLPAIAWAVDSVDYVDIPEGGATNSCANYTSVTADTTAWSTGWYVVNSTVQIGTRIQVNGEVNLILTDGCNLTASEGISVANDSSLTVWGQSDGTGVLNADGANDAAGIGGDYGKNRCTITINGGTVNARSNRGAGIGGGANNTCATITINGGTVTASSKKGGAGIGGGVSGGSTAVTINGGTVTAIGGAKDEFFLTGGGAGIGSGDIYGATWEGTITVQIHGGAVYAAGGGSAAGIGGGGNSSDEGSAGGKVTVSGNSRVTAIGGAQGGVGIGGGLGDSRGDAGTLHISSGTVVVDASSIEAVPTVAEGASAILFNGKDGMVYGNAVLNSGETLDISAGETLQIPSGASLTVPSGAKLIVRDGAALHNKGTVTIDPGSSFIKEPDADVTGVTGENPPSYAAPAATVDYINETLKGLVAGAQYRIKVNDTAQTVTAQSDGTIPIASDWLGQTLSITRICPDGSDTIQDSDPQTLFVKQRPNAPNETNCGAVAPPYKGGLGRIWFDPDEAYQYGTDRDEIWKTLDISMSFPAGTYYVRFAPTASDFASEERAIVIPDGEIENPIELSVGGQKLELSQMESILCYRLDFGSAEYGYTETPAQKTVTITNKGAGTAEITASFFVDGDTGFKIEWDEKFSQAQSEGKPVSLAQNQTAAFSIQPTTGCDIGNCSTWLAFFVRFTPEGQEKPLTDKIDCQAVFRVLPAAPVFRPNAGEFTGKDGVAVEITCPTGNAVIYYTTDGTEPELNFDFDEATWEISPVPANDSTKKYEQAISVTDTTVIKAVSVAGGGVISLPSTATYTKINIVTFDSKGGSATKEQRVKNGTTAAKPADPTREGHTFGGWFTDAECTTAWNFGSPVNESMTLYAKWDVKSTVETPVLEPVPAEGESFDESVTVSITCATEGAEIYYTTDGTEPTASSTKYEAAFKLTKTTTVKAIAVKTDWNNSAVASATYTKKDPPAPDGHEHNYTEEIITQPTCTEAGEKTLTCTECGKEKTEEIPALGHDFDEGKITKEPTEEAEGERTYTCTRCGETKTESIPALGQHTHTFGEGTVTKAATCTEAGEKTLTCTECGEKKTEEIPALGHDFDEGKITKEPTAEEEGEWTYTCTRCGATQTDAIPKEPGQTPDPEPERPDPTPEPPVTPKPEPPEQPEQDNWQEQISAVPEAGGDAAWKYVDSDGVTATTPQILPARDGTARLYLFDAEGLLQTGATPVSIAANGTEIRITPEGDVGMNGCLYYLNPNRVLTDPSSCYVERDYMRALAGGAGSRFYDKNGITFAGWLRGSDGKMRYQTVIQTENGDRYLLVVWRVQTLPACQDPDHPGDPAYIIPAGRYFFDDFGVLVTEEGWNDGKDGKEYYTNAKGQVLSERPRA